MPQYANGKICYLELPATDIPGAAAFYADVFGWDIRERGDGTTSFDDTVGGVSGAWVTNERPADPGLLVHVMVANVAKTLDKIVARGGAVVQPIGAHLPEITARFRDPAGNVLGLYQQSGLAEPS